MRRFIWVLLALLLPVYAFALGEQYGRITGIVYSPEGAEMPNVKITLTSSALIGGPRTLYSTYDGSFTFNNVPPGKYEITVEYPGLKIVIQKGVRVTVGKTASLYVTMELSTKTDTTVILENREKLVDTTNMTQSNCGPGFAVTPEELKGLTERRYVDISELMDFSEPLYRPEPFTTGLLSLTLPTVGKNLPSSPEHFSLDLPMVGQSLPSVLLNLPSSELREGQVLLQGRPVSVVLDGVLLPSQSITERH